MQVSNSTSNTIYAITQEASIAMLKSISSKNVTLTPTTDDRIVYGHWMAMVLLVSEKLKLVFKVQFMSKSSRYFAERIVGRRSVTQSTSSSLDLMKEFCNLTIGKVKARLSESDIATSVSLPITAKGFDEVLLGSGGGSSKWVLGSEGFQVFCEAQLELFGDIEFTESNQAQTSGSVEFL